MLDDQHQLILSTIIANALPAADTRCRQPVLFLPAPQFVQLPRRTRRSAHPADTPRRPRARAASRGHRRPPRRPRIRRRRYRQLGRGRIDHAHRNPGHGTVGTDRGDAIPGNGQVTVSWVTPDDGGRPITAYVVTTYVGGVIQALTAFSSSATSQVIVGFTNDTAYSFTVAATNAVGTSSPVTPSSEVSPIAPALSIIDGGTRAGHAQSGDKIIVTFFTHAFAQCLLRLLERHVVSRSRRPQRDCYGNTINVGRRHRNRDRRG